MAGPIPPRGACRAAPSAMPRRSDAPAKPAPLRLDRCHDRKHVRSTKGQQWGLCQDEVARVDSAQPCALASSPEIPRTRSHPLLIPRSKVRILHGPLLPRTASLSCSGRVPSGRGLVGGLGSSVPSNARERRGQAAPLSNRRRGNQPVPPHRSFATCPCRGRCRRGRCRACRTACHDPHPSCRGRKA